MVDASTAWQLIRNALCVIVGLLAGSVVNMGLTQLNTHVFFPMPPGTTMEDAAQFNAYLSALPTSAFLVVVVAHLGQAFVGGWVAARLAVSHPRVLAMCVGVFSLVGGIVAMQMIEGPAWLVIELPLYLVVAWLAGRIEHRRRETATAQSGFA